MVAQGTRGFIYRGFSAFLDSIQDMYISYNVKRYSENKFRKMAYIKGVEIVVDKMRLVDLKEKNDVGKEILLIRKTGVIYRGKSNRFFRKRNTETHAKEEKILEKIMFMWDRGFRQEYIAKKVNRSQSYVSQAIKRHKRNFSIEAVKIEKK